MFTLLIFALLLGLLRVTVNVKMNISFTILIIGVVTLYFFQMPQDLLPLNMINFLVYLNSCANDISNVHKTIIIAF